MYVCIVLYILYVLYLTELSCCARAFPLALGQSSWVTGARWGNKNKHHQIPGALGFRRVRAGGVRKYSTYGAVFGAQDQGGVPPPTHATNKIKDRTVGKVGKVSMCHSNFSVRHTGSNPLPPIFRPCKAR